jgi:serine/threonine-protein kinase ULK4
MDNYHIYDEIGRGKHSVVYKGRLKKSLEYVALKSVDKKQAKKVHNEVQIMHKLDSPSTLKFHNW